MTTNSIHAAIDQFLLEHLDHYIQEIGVLCAQPSVSATGEGIEMCAKLVADILALSNFKVQVIENAGNPVIVARAEGRSERTLLFYNHYDVQPPEPLALWTSPPFEPTIREGALYARGAKDDKGEMIARLAAVDAVRHAYNGELPCNVLFVVEGNEEMGSPYIADFVREHKNLLQADGAIWEEGSVNHQERPYISIGVRGALAIELSVQTMSHDAHSGGAHILPSAAWRLVHALASLKGTDERIQIEGFYDDVLPPSELEQSLLDDLPRIDEVLRDVYHLDEFVLGRIGKELHHAVLQPTCNVQGIVTGYQGEGGKTIVPAKATVKMDFRLVPNQEPDDILRKLRKHLNQHGFHDVKIIYHGAMSPFRSQADDPFVQLAAQTAPSVYKKEALVLPTTGGSSPMYAFARPLGNIPVIAVGLGYWNNCTHAPDEHIRLQDFLNASRHIARILDGFADI